MNCPRCGQELASRTVDTQVVEECPGGDGMWLSAAEFHAAVEAAAPDLGWMDFDVWKDTEQFTVSVKPVPCPACGAGMLTLAYGGIEVDHCRGCQGIWLDAGELTKVVAALNEEANSRTVPDYVSASLEEAREFLSGPSGPHAEWRDLRQVLRLLQYRLLSEHPSWLKSITDIERSIPS